MTDVDPRHAIGRQDPLCGADGTGLAVPAGRGDVRVAFDGVSRIAGVGSDQH